MMNTTASTPLGQLLSRFGNEVIITAADVLDGISTDHRKLYVGRALALALPRTTAEVADILRFCNALRIPVVPQGGNTGYCAAGTPDESGTQLVMSLRRMNRIRSVEPLNNSLVVEAGCVLKEIQMAAEAADRYFPLSLGSEGSCTIGGNLSTNAGGVNVLRYGMTRELTLGLEVVLADGRVLSSLSALRKDNTGYDLRQWFIGAEGTLGVITAASLKLFPLPKRHGTAVVAVPSVKCAVELLAELRAGSGDRVSSFELLPRSALELVERHSGARLNITADSPWCVLCEVSSSDTLDPIEERLASLLEGAMERGLVTDALLAQSERERLAYWFVRENIPEAQRRDGPSVKHDVSLPIDRLAEFVYRASDWVVKHVPEGFLVCYGHVGDGNLHFNINQSNGTAGKSLLAREPEIRRAIHDLVQEYRGSFSAEHGIGRHKVDELERYTDPVELQLMQQLKQALDPNGILNPGKVLRTRH
ncbi:MAG: putative glycolate oxidase subunit GlcD [Pseudomonadota bacterium]